MEQANHQKWFNSLIKIIDNPYGLQEIRQKKYIVIHTDTHCPGYVHALGEK